MNIFILFAALLRNASCPMMRTHPSRDGRLSQTRKDSGCQEKGMVSVVNVDYTIVEYGQTRGVSYGFTDCCLFEVMVPTILSREVSIPVVYLLTPKIVLAPPISRVSNVSKSMLIVLSRGPQNLFSGLVWNSQQLNLCSFKSTRDEV